MPELAPFLVAPRYVPKPWGGRRLATRLGRRDLPDGAVGESWEVGTLDGWDPLVETGPGRGRPLRAVWGGPFPLLIKVLDANEDLSVQVHPDGRDGAPAKEEAWVSLAAGGAVAVGTVDASALPAAGAWLGRLTRRPLAAPGAADAPPWVHVPPGTVHAILAPSLVWEVQTPVDVTWRLDDHGRLGLDGRPRALHLEAARAVLARGSEPVATGRGLHLSGRRFALDAHPPGTWPDVPGCALFLLEGGRLRHAQGVLDVPRGRTVVLGGGAVEAHSPGWMFAAGPS